VSLGPDDSSQCSPLHRRFDRPRNSRPASLVDGCVEIAVEHLAALLTAECTVGQAQITVHPATNRAGFGRWLPPARDDDPTAIPRGLVSELPPELAASHIANRLRQVMVRQQAGHI